MPSATLYANVRRRHLLYVGCRISPGAPVTRLRFVTNAKRPKARTQNYQLALMLAFQLPNAMDILLSSLRLFSSGFNQELPAAIELAMPVSLCIVTAGLFQPALIVLHRTKRSAVALAFGSSRIYPEKVGIDIGVESELIQPQRRFFPSPLTAFR